MKVEPIVRALETGGGEVTIVHTGQHYDPSMSEVFFEDLRLREPDHHLGVGSGSHAHQTAGVMVAFESLMEQLGPSTVVVVGDVNSTMACALVAAKAGAMVAHVEAGLRSRDWSMPEEINRVVTDRVSDYLLAPSEDAVENLQGEGFRDDQMHLVGNVMVDTLLRNLDKARERPILNRLGLSQGEYGVVTLHRPSNVDDPLILTGLLEALGEVAAACPLVFPTHPRTAARLGDISVPAGLRMTEPLGYLDFLALEAGARLVLTDSGGVQEETTVLGVSCLTLRENTERPATVSAGTNLLVGRDPNRIVAEATRVLEHPLPARRPPLWDGHAAERIATILLDERCASELPRPTQLGGSAR